MRTSSRLLSDHNGTPLLRLRSINRSHIFLFILWPFGQMINALRHFRQPWSMALMWLFCVYFGFVLIYDDPFGWGGSDSARYAAQLIEMHNQAFSFTQLWSSLYALNSNQVDVYQPLLTWVIALFTENPAFLFAAFAAVFGFFYVKNLWMIFNKVTVNVNVFIFFFMLLYALVNPIWNINSARMWTAAHVFLFGNLLYFLNGNRRGLIWSAASVLFHFSFMFPVALLLIWQIIPRKAWLLFVFYIVTAFITEINLTGVQNILSFLPDIFETRMSKYLTEHYAENIKIISERTLLFELVKYASRFLLYTWLIYVFVERRKWWDYNKEYKHFFLFALYFGGFANIFANVPSGSRFLTISTCLFHALFILLFGKNYLNVRWLKRLSLPLLFFVVLFQIRIGFEFIGILTFFGNPLIAPIIDAQMPLIEFVKNLFQ